MQKAIWISRHDLAPEQIEDAARMGYDLSHPEEGRWIGNLSLDNNDDVRAFMSALESLVRDTQADAVFGVFAAPVQMGLTEFAKHAALETTSTLPCFAAWSVMRSVEGGRPTFQHKAFVLVGELRNPR